MRLLGGHAQLVVEGVVPDLLHVVPVGHDAVLYGGYLRGQNTALGLGLVAHVGVLLVHARNDSRVLGAWGGLGGPQSRGTRFEIQLQMFRSRQPRIP
jgi:hypothetical protein